MDTILQGPNHVQCYIGHILVTGADDDEHFFNQEEVLARLCKELWNPDKIQ